MHVKVLCYPTDLLAHSGTTIVISDPEFHLLPSNCVLCLLLNESYALQYIGDVIDSTLLLHIQSVCSLWWKSKYGSVSSNQQHADGAYH